MARKTISLHAFEGVAHPRARAKPPGRRGKTAGKRAQTPKARLTQLERTTLSDQRMLEAAVKLIYERGTHNTTLKDIGELAGYSRGLASSRFGSKDSLFFELLRRFNQRWKEKSGTSVGLRTGLDAFEHANHGLIAFFETESMFIRVMYQVSYEMVGSSERMRQQLAEQHEAYRHGVTRWLEEARAAGEIDISSSAERAALQYCSTVFGLIYQWLVNPQAIDIREGLTDLRQNLLALIKR